jgi:hypothetical protein
MKDWAALVTEFNEAQGQRPARFPDARLPYDILLVRLRLMHEELFEYILAVQENEPVEKVADSICDLLYVVVGTAVAHGMGPILDEMFREVHRSNITKDFRPIGNGEKGGFKGESYSPPLLGPILRRVK